MCLASGSKDPCVRCGHRPSKRMEQLVHLRLKSIYKAFKSSGSPAAGGGGGNGPPGGGRDPSGGPLEQHQVGGYSSNHSSTAASSNVVPFHRGPRRNKSATLQDIVGNDGNEDEEGEGDDDDDGHVVDLLDYDDIDDGNVVLRDRPGRDGFVMINPKDGGTHGRRVGHAGRDGRNSSSNSSNLNSDHHHPPRTRDARDGYAQSMGMMLNEMLPPKFCRDLAQDYIDQQKRADEAAEALLAELEEEEEARAQKVSKKKKKKKAARKTAASGSLSGTADDVGQPPEQHPDEEGDDRGRPLGEPPAGPTRYDDGDDDEGHDIPGKVSDPDDPPLHGRVSSGMDKVRERRRMDDDDDDVEDVGGMALGTSDSHVSNNNTTDPIERELIELVENGDIDGIEDILTRIKGVPGRAALRKNAKKALKRLRQEVEVNSSPLDDDPGRAGSVGRIEEQPWQPTTPAKPPTTTTTTTTTTAKRTTMPSEGPAQSKAAPAKSGSAPAKGGRTSAKPPPSRSSNQTATSAAAAAAARAESTIQISATLVGWIIGKGGQKIRDMMDESGAKIWIDQEKVKGQAIRNVYVSGDREAVEHGVQLVKEVVANAPPPPQAALSTQSGAAAAVKAEGAGPAVSLPPASTNPPRIVPQTASGPIPERPSAMGYGTPSEPEPKEPTTETMADRLRDAAKAESAGTKQHRPPPPSAWGSGQGRHPPNVDGQNDSLTTIDGATTKPVTAAVTSPDAVDADMCTEVVDCEARFVPLLIGRRGWTIKHIQDESGARVDIDQSVTPRQVRISGCQANVEKAVTLVRDVLAYPHAQLQASSDGVDEIGAIPSLLTNIGGSLAHPINEEFQGQASMLEGDAANNVLSFLIQDSDSFNETNDRNQSPPPLVGDAKSAISASSSLSSTPEPSMASSSKGLLAASQLDTGPSILSNSEQYSSLDCSPYPPPGPSLQPDLTMADASGGLKAYVTSASAGGAAASQQQVYGQSGGHLGIPRGHASMSLVPEILRHHPHQQNYPEPTKSAPRMRPGMMQPPQNFQQQQRHQTYPPQPPPTAFGHTGQMRQTMPYPIPGSTSPVARVSGQFEYFGNSGHAQSFHSASGRSAYGHYPTEIASSAQGVAGSAPLRDVMSTSMGRIGPAAPPSPMMPTTAYGPGSGSGDFWGSGPSSSYPAPRHQAGPRLPPVTPTGYSTSSLGFSHRQAPPPQQPRAQHQPHYASVKAPLGLHESSTLQQQAQQSQQQQHLAAATFAVEGRFAASPFSAMNSAMPQNDSGMIFDSLFSGTSVGTTDANSDVLQGFHGLSLGDDLGPTKSSGLWGPSLLSDMWVTADISSNNNSNVNSYNNITRADIEGADPASAGSSIDHLLSGPGITEDYPDESRFNWSSTNP